MEFAASNTYSSSSELDEPRALIDYSHHANDSNNENGLMLHPHPTLDYINRILLEEDIDEQFGGYQEEAALSEIEKPFYDIIGEKYPPFPPNQSASGRSNSEYHKSCTSISNDEVVSGSSCASLVPDAINESVLTREFQRGVEEGMKFLPSINNLAIDLHVGRLSLDTTPPNNDNLPEIDLEEDVAYGSGRCNCKKNSTDADLSFMEGRNSKRSVICTEETIRDEMFDKVLLNHGEEYAREEISRLRAIMKCQADPQFAKKDNEEGIIDLESLLIQCAEAVAHNNHKVAEELIKEIRSQASPVGSGDQRVASILCDGLEARLVGTGSETYRQLVNRRISTRELLKAYHMYITASPLLRVSYWFANEHISKVAENALKIHIVDLGITFGFQWPPLIQALAKRKGGPPKLRITGIDFPQPGFRPEEQIKQIGVRLNEYAKSFGIPFEYQCIASSWECIRIEDLKLDDDEVLIVNSMFRFKQIRDETFSMDSPRNRVLSLVQQMKPKIFVLGIFNVHFSPLFVRRFKKVLLHYSMLFDMFDTLVPRSDKGRQVMERELLARCIVNLVACEGPDWVERPETYQQWHKRVSRAGFEQVAMDRNILKDCNRKVKSSYHEGFFIEEESGWLLQGWKGRINYGLSVWEPKKNLNDSILEK